MWYSEAAALLISTIFFLIFTLLLALDTLMVTQCAGKGKWTKTLFTLQKFTMFLGILIFVVGLVARIVKQPFHVWFPLCLAGLLYIITMLLQYLISRSLYSSYQKKQKAAENEAMKKDEKKEIADPSADPDSKKNKYKDIYNNLSK